ncbi:alpha/beta hydrolase [Flavobacterium pectinovorum]|uniref:alpha/beta fold hydrolase n=1 Tax=Flavobacterium pectinovorum TaxID=29533 RepID=UPI00265FFCC9|nr:alpha/beta hydrolase [Flavobacterium pectinovorum]WKL49246.1 alpha/beta hydrolase [Flavobacterium pectinovorum]
MKNLFLSAVILFTASLYAQQPKPMRYALQSIAAPQKTTPYGNNAAAGHYITSDDAKIYYEVYGKGTPVLILHGGIFGSTFEMYHFIDSLKVNHQVIAVSTRGHGKSELGNQPHTYQLKAKDAVTVLNAVTKDSATVIGFSDGGYTGYVLASLYSSKIKKLVVIGAGERHPGDQPNAITVKQALELDKPFWDQQLALMPDPKRLPELFTRVQEEFNTKLVADEKLFSTIKCPVLVMVGDHDNFISVEHADHAAKFIPKGQLSVIPGAGHGAFLEKWPVAWPNVNYFLQH